MTNTVTVGCKLPNGLIISVAGKKPVTLAGANSSRIIGGYGLTPVPSDIWDEWSKKMTDSDLIKNNLIFANATAARAESQAKEQASVTTGLEPLKRNDGDTPSERR